MPDFHPTHRSQPNMAVILSRSIQTAFIALPLVVLSACTGNSANDEDSEPLQGRALASTPTYRINSGGELITADDGNWLNDKQNPANYRNTGKSSSNNADVKLTDTSIPPGTPSQLFATEQWDIGSAPDMTWKLPVVPGEYEVRLYFAETWAPSFSVGKRVFDVAIEGQILLDDYDIFDDVGANTAVMKSFTVTSDASLDIEFFHEAQNPSVKAIEIYSTTETPVSPVSPPPAPPPSSDSTIEVEVENYTNNIASDTHSWIVSDLDGASGGVSMVTTPNNESLKANANNSPMLSYNVDFPNAGTWYVWLRGYGDTDSTGEGKNDSVHVGLNGILAMSADKIDEFPPGWNWSQHTRDKIVATLSVPSAGEHIVNIWMREDGLTLDKFVLSNNPIYNPDSPSITPNTAPVVNAGIDATFNTGENVSLTGRVDDDGLPANTLTSTWTKATGPGIVTFSDTASAVTSANFSQTGSYELELTATDTELSDSDTVTITITEGAVPAIENTAPVVSAGTDITAAMGDSVSLLGSVSDDGLPNDVLSMTWLKSDGPGSVTFSDSTAAATNAVFSLPGNYELTLIGDDSVLRDSDTTKVTITDSEPVTPAIGSEPVFRINAGGPSIPNTQLDWMNNVQRGATDFVNTGVASEYSAAIDTTHPSLPSDIPETIFNTGRWDRGSSPEMQWTFPVTSGDYEVRLYFAETWAPAFAIGKRVFNVLIEGNVVLENYDIFADVGKNAGVMKSFTINSDTELEIDFQHIVQNPSLRGIEILSTSSNINLALVVDAGADQSTGFGSDVNLVGNVTDDGRPNNSLSATWRLLSGPGLAQFSDPTDLETMVSFSETGTYQIQLTVNDGDLSATDVTAVTVNAPSTGTPNLRITEFLSSNDKGLEDEEGDNNDWIEIENQGDTPVDLAGIYLTDDIDDLTQWAFPAASLSAGESIVVFASGEDRIGALPFHTNFKLKTGGEYLAIVDTDGTTVIDEFSPEYPDQYTDISYGIDADGNYQYFASPTPDQTNTNSGYNGYLEIKFSEKRGYYDSPLELELSTGGGAAIRYTLNGDEPTANTGIVYTGPIQIDKTTVVRAYAEKDGYLSPVSMTHTYLFIDDVVNQTATIPGYPNNQYNLGTGGAKAQHDYEMDPVITQDPAYLTDLKQGLQDIPAISLALDKDELFGNLGFYDQDDLEVPISMEIIYADKPKDSHQVNAGAESHSHKRLKRSIRVNFKSKYGYSSLKSDLLQRAPVNGGSATDKFDRLILRGGNNRAWTRNWNPDDTAFTVDQFYRDTQIAVSGIGSHGNFAHLYINGLYWGLYNIAERPDDNFSEEYLGGDDDDYFFIKHGSAGKGDDSRYKKLVNDLIKRNLANAANYTLLQEYLNIEKFIDYIIVNFYSAVTDWPHNNFYGGNRNDSSPLGPTPFQYYAWDGEWSWNNQRTGNNPGGRARVHADFESGVTATSSDPAIQRIWHAVRVNPDFLNSLQNRVDELTAEGAALSDSVAAERWETINEFIRNAVVAESARWGDAMESIDGKTRTRDSDWENAVDDISGYINGNAAALKNSLRENGLY